MHRIQARTPHQLQPPKDLTGKKFFTAGARPGVERGQPSQKSAPAIQAQSSPRIRAADADTSDDKARLAKRRMPLAQMTSAFLRQKRLTGLPSPDAKVRQPLSFS